MQTYNLPLTYAQIQELDKFIKGLITIKTDNTDEKLLIATMAQIGAITDSKLGTFKQINNRYKIKINTAQMYAIVLLSQDYVTDVQTYLGNYLHTQSFKIKQILTC